MQNIQKHSKLGPRKLEIKDSKDCLDRRSLRLRSERDFDREQKSKFD